MLKESETNEFSKNKILNFVRHKVPNVNRPNDLENYFEHFMPQKSQVYFQTVGKF